MAARKKRGRKGGRRKKGKLKGAAKAAFLARMEAGRKKGGKRGKRASTKGGKMSPAARKALLAAFTNEGLRKSESEGALTALQHALSGGKTRDAEAFAAKMSKAKAFAAFSNKRLQDD